MGSALGEDDDHQTEGLDLRPERFQPCAGDLLTLDVRADLDAAHAEFGCQIPQFLHGRLRVLQRDRPERQEAAGVAGGGLDELLVDDSRGLRAKFRVGPVVVLVHRDRDRLDVHAHPLHVGDADVEHVHLGSDRLELASVHRLGRGVAVSERDLVGCDGGVLHELGGRRAFSMAMDVDDRTVAAERPSPLCPPPNPQPEHRTHSWCPILPSTVNVCAAVSRTPTSTRSSAVTQEVAPPVEGWQLLAG